MPSYAGAHGELESGLIDFQICRDRDTIKTAATFRPKLLDRPAIKFDHPNSHIFLARHHSRQYTHHAYNDTFANRKANKIDVRNPCADSKADGDTSPICYRQR